MYSYLFIFIVALFISFIVTPLVRELALRRGWVDRPDGNRKIHRIPTPSIGGVGIYCAFALSLVPLYFLDTAVALYLRENLFTVLTVVGLTGLMMLVGLWDDLRSLSPWTKLSAQFFIATLCWFAHFRILDVWGGQHIAIWGWMSFPLTVVWILLITNAFNLIDGLDGLASGAALFSILAMLVFSISSRQTHSVIYLAGLAGALLGFLRYNFNPASIFLGDSGSLQLGFLLSLAAIIGSQKSTAAFSIAVPVVALGLPLVDTSLTVARRFLRGRPLFSADGRHIHHVLIQKGLPTRRAALVLYAICGLFGLFSLFFVNPTGKSNGVILAVIGIAVFFGIQKLRYSELSALGGHLSRGFQNQRKLLAGGVVVQNIIEGLQKTENLCDLLNAVGRGLEELCFSRVEILFSNCKTLPDVGIESNWTVMPHPHGGALIRWTSSCSYCDDCQKCEVFKNPILQKAGRLDSRNSLRRDIENQITIPLCGNGGGNLGAVRFYYLDNDVYPVSAIAILSKNIGREFERAIEQALDKDSAFRDALSLPVADNTLSRMVQ